MYRKKGFESPKIRSYIIRHVESVRVNGVLCRVHVLADNGAAVNLIQKKTHMKLYICQECALRIYILGFQQGASIFRFYSETRA